jgi:hypothetical protein
MWHKPPKHELWTERLSPFSVADPFPCASSCYVKLKSFLLQFHSGPLLWLHPIDSMECKQILSGRQCLME